MEALWAAFRFLGTLTLGFAENVDVPGIGKFEFTACHPLLLDETRFCMAEDAGDCRDGAGGLPKDGKSWLPLTWTDCSKSISASSA